MKIDDLIDKIDMLQFFNQRAGRELWQEKPKDVQNTDIENADNILDEVKKYLKKYRWHDLRKNQEDLPEGNWDTPLDIVVESKLNSRVSGLHYASANYVRGEFKYYDSKLFDKVVKWKYIEPFDEVEE